MQRWNEELTDVFGNRVAGAQIEVFNTGTLVYASVYDGNNSTDNPTTVKTQPMVTGADGRYGFAANDGDYDIKVTYPDLSTWTRYRVNLFDSTTATTVPVSSISFSAPAQYAVTGSPGTAITLAWNSQAANTFLCGPNGSAGVPTFRTLAAADINLVAVDLTTVQTANGNKTWGGTALFNGAVTHASTFTQTGTSTFSADITWGTNVDLVMDKTSKFYIGAVGTGGYKATYGMIQPTSLVSGTLPTATTFLVSMRGYLFSAAATNELIYCLVLPFDYREGTDIYPFVQWTTTGTNAGNVRWCIEYTVVKGYNQGVLPATTTVAITPAASGTVNQLMTSEFAAITGTNFEPDTLMWMRVYRDGSNGADTCTDTAFLFAVGVHHQSTRFATKNKAPNFYT